MRILGITSIMLLVVFSFALIGCDSFSKSEKPYKCEKYFRSKDEAEKFLIGNWAGVKQELGFGPFTICFLENKRFELIDRSLSHREGGGIQVTGVWFVKQIDGSYNVVFNYKFDSATNFGTTNTYERQTYGPIDYCGSMAVKYEI